MSRCVRGCGNFGNPARGGQCNSCYRKHGNAPVANQSNHGGDGGIPTHRPQQPPPPQPQRQRQPPNHPSCAIPSCTNYPSHGSFCNSHYQQQLQAAAINVNNAPPTRPAPLQVNQPKQCIVHSCNYYASHYDYCNTHKHLYQQMQGQRNVGVATNTQQPPVTRVVDSRHCQVPGCTNFAAREGRCNGCIRAGKSITPAASVATPTVVTGSNGAGGAHPGHHGVASQDEVKAPVKSPLQQLQEAYQPSSALVDSKANSKTILVPLLERFSQCISRLFDLSQPKKTQSQQDLETIKQLIAMLTHIQAKETKASEFGWRLIASSYSDNDILHLSHVLLVHLTESSSLLLQLTQALRSTMRFGTLVKYSQTVLPAIFPESTTSNRTQTLDVLEDAMLGFTHQPNLFFSSLPRLLRLCQDLEQERDEKNALRLVTLCRAMFVALSGYPVVQEYVEREFKSYPPVNRQQLEELLVKVLNLISNISYISSIPYCIFLLSLEL